MSINNAESMLAGDEADEFSVTATIENVGETQVTQDVSVIYEDRVLANQTVTLDGGESTTVSLPFIAQTQYDGTQFTVATADATTTTAATASVAEVDLIDTAFVNPDGTVNDTLTLSGVEDPDATTDNAEYDVSLNDTTTNQVVVAIGNNTADETRFELDGADVLIDT